MQDIVVPTQLGKITRIFCLCALITGCLTLRQSIASQSYRHPILDPAPVDNSVQALSLFNERDPDYTKKAKERWAQIAILYPKLSALAAEKNPVTHKPKYEMDCPSQLLNELTWRLGSTDDFGRVDGEIEEFKKSLASIAQSGSPEYEPAKADHQSDDGSWGVFFHEWFLKLTTTIDALEQLTKNHGTPEYRFKFLDKVSTKKGLLRYLKSILVSDIKKTGVDHRRELNESFSTLIRMVLRNEPSGVFEKGTKDAILEFLSEWQSPDTGYWGPRYVTSDGHLVQVDDLSITFHNLSYVDGGIMYWDKIIATTLSNLNCNTHLGPLANGILNNHMNMDVARIFRMGWNHATDGQKATIQTTLLSDLKWCLAQSLQPDGSFKPSVMDADIPDQMYFGVAFLNEAGFLSKDPLMLPGVDFNQADEIRSRIAAHIENLRAADGSMNPYLQHALELVKSPQPTPSK